MMDALASARGKMVGMYVHQHWPYNHPYSARTWTVEDWRGYADGLTRLGYNTILFWPMLETVPDPPTQSDIAGLEKLRHVIAMLHQEFGMRVLMALCPNVAPDDEAARSATFEKRHFFYSDRRVDPGDPRAMADLMARRAKLLVPLREVDGVCIIDSDPGGYPGSTNQEFVDLLAAHRRLFDSLRPGIEIIYWMHAGWLGYNRFYETGVLSFSTDEENLDCLMRLMQANPEPWGLANGLPLAEKLGIADRVISYNYGRIEGEPSFPLTNFGGDSAWEGGNAPGPHGVMGNAQTHCVQLPNTFAFARGAQGLPVTEADYLAFAEELIPGLGAQIVGGWKTLHGTDSAAMRAAADGLDAVPDSALQPGRLQGLLFGSPRRFLSDLAHMLRMRAAYAALQAAEGTPSKAMVRDFSEAASAWQAQHGYENAWWWPDLHTTLRRIGSPEVDTVLDSQFNPFAPPPPGTPGTPFEYVAEALRFTESFTPRLLTALRKATQ
jgi:hypothetical protein